MIFTLVKDDESNTVGLGIEGPCPNCNSGDNSIIVTHNQVLTNKKRRIKFRCISCKKRYAITQTFEGNEN